VDFVPSGVAHFQGILNFWPSQFVVAAETAARELGSLNVSEALGRPSSSGELPVALRAGGGQPDWTRLRHPERIEMDLRRQVRGARTVEPSAWIQHVADKDRKLW
jgi:hypothetical protein